MADMTRVGMRVRGAEVVTVPIDDTLTIEGQAADAKATGDALALKADKSELQAAVKVNNQPADAQGLILIDGRHIPISDQDTETLANAVTDLKGKTAADIPMSSDSSAKTIAEVVNANSEAIEGMEEMTGATMPIESGSQTTVKAAIEARVKTVNRKAPDADGDVDLSVVPLAENLQSDKMENVEGSFIIRTTGGNASVSDGKAYPLHLFGAAEHTGYVAEELNMTVIPITRTEPDEPITATIDRGTFVAYVDESSTINLYYTTEWSADPELYGITVTGTPVAGDQITIVYVKEVRGTISVANPARLVGTGWNLFDYNNGYARVVKYSTEYGYKIGGSYASLQFSATLTGERSSITPGVDGLFNVPSDGYVFVTGGNNTDTYILTTWSDWMEGPSSGYWEPYRESGIDLSAVMTTYFPNGLLAVGTTRDEIDLSAKRSISRIERMAYSEENRAAAAASGRSYDFDQNYIYIVRESAVISAITIDTTYNVSEHGLEWFTETTLPVISEILYGKNLRDKLERDVVTISAQTLTEEEKAQVRTNIGAMSQADGDKKLVAPTTAGTNGQLLQTNGDGTTNWTTQGTPTDAQVGTAVSAWLTAHPEATTTVQDGAISRAKLNDDLKAKTDAVSDLKSAFDSEVEFSEKMYGESLTLTSMSLTWEDGSWTDGGSKKSLANAKRYGGNIKNTQKTVIILKDYSYSVKLLIYNAAESAITSVTNKKESAIIPALTTFKIAVEGTSAISDINDVISICPIDDKYSTVGRLFQTQEYIGYKEIVYTDKTSINCNVDVGEEVTISQSSATAYRSCVLDCLPGDILVLNIKGGNNPRTYAMLDANNLLVSKSGNAETVNGNLVIPDGVCKIILNDTIKTNITYRKTSVSEGVAVSSFVEIMGVGTQSGGNSGVTKAGQCYINTVDHMVHLVTGYTSSTVFNHVPVAVSKEKLFVFKGMIGRFNYETGAFTPIPGQQIVVQAIGLKSYNTSEIRSAGQFYIHATERKLKLCTSYTSETNFTDTNVPMYKDILYILNGKEYEYYGTDGNVSNGASDGLVEKRTPSFASASGQNEIMNFAEDNVCTFVRGISFADELKSPIVDMKKDGDLMVHVSTFRIINDVIYCTYYVNTRHGQEDPTEHTARFVYCSLSSPSSKTYVDLQDVGDTFDGKTVQAIYDTILLTKDDDVLFLMWTAKLDGAYYRLYKTYTISTGTMSDTNYNYFYAENVGGIWNTANMLTAIESKMVWHKPIGVNDDIGLMQKLTSREESGTTYYYTGSYAGRFNCIVKSSDLINWHFVAAPDFYTESQWENAVYVIGNIAYYFVRQTNEMQTGFLVTYDILNKKWSEPIYVLDCQSRSDFFEYNGNLYLVHAPKDRNHISVMQINKSYPCKSFELQTAKVPDYFYPFVQVYNNELYMSFTQTRAHIYISKFTIGESNDSIITKFKTLLT